MAEAGPPLAGVRVVELGNIIGGPYAGMLLADMGADVVKVEPPGGDLARGFGAVRRRGELLLRGHQPGQAQSRR